MDNGSEYMAGGILAGMTGNRATDLLIDWKGESGFIHCRDGLDWFVLCIPAEADRVDDPLGREVGEGLWPEWFKAGHFDRFKEKQRTWNALFQQKPTSETGTFFKADWFDLKYERAPAKERLRIFGCSDYAVTPDGGDFTEHGIFGMARSMVMEPLLDAGMRYEPKLMNR